MRRERLLEQLDGLLPYQTMKAACETHYAPDMGRGGSRGLVKTPAIRPRDWQASGLAQHDNKYRGLALH